MRNKVDIKVKYFFKKRIKKESLKKYTIKIIFLFIVGTVQLLMNPNNCVNLLLLAN